MPPLNNKHIALVLIDVQEGFRDPLWGPRNNPSAEENIQLLLGNFRSREVFVIHVQHLSTEKLSPLRPGQPGVEFINGFTPRRGERVFQKTVNSAFIGTGLESYLRAATIETLVMTGFTSDHCVSTSARMASNLGFKVVVASDATATFQRVSYLGENIEAELVHRVALASLSGEFAEVQTTREILNQ
ncbi:MAG: hypothetical protein A4S09_05800 [Proteobacteria bacterium SG_bin7]|nr:MAG: hypothetical protein A4S09_05800 [Proteobacteria bacterium SG_bin7]